MGKFKSFFSGGLRNDLLDSIAYRMQNEKAYDFPAPPGFEERWSIRSATKALFAKELKQCPKCEVYHDDPDHYCGSVALVCYVDTPQSWSERWYHGFRCQTFML